MNLLSTDAQRETRDIPVIALSAAATARDVKRGTQGGFVRYLTKPVRVDELTNLLETLLVQPGSGAASAPSGTAIDGGSAAAM